ncbi:uncharacterized protein LOC105628382 [Jatropha curcas]|uniref:uncharacterized protein LOC105628382 n=1 Tax=Jatropha curcas TaxID=180498 RepID=UPI001895BA2E|nr:uncharacterized protein LOC105628382 [Jatropha curcas]
MLFGRNKLQNPRKRRLEIQPRSALLFDDDMVIRALRAGSRILLYDVEKIMAPNLLILREIGMTQSLINMLLTYHSSLICHKVDKFRDKVKEVINMGFCPTKTKFVHALHAIISISKSNWQHKIELYGRYGWSEDEMLSVFKKHPLCMYVDKHKEHIPYLLDVFEGKGRMYSEELGFQYGQ